MLIAAALAGNVVGYEIGRKIGPPLYQHDGRILKREYFTKTEAFFEKHGRKALVIGRFVPFVRTYITVVAGATKMDRRKFLVWSLVGAVAWVASIMLLGYFVGASVPWLATNIDYADPRPAGPVGPPDRDRVVATPRRRRRGRDEVDQPEQADHRLGARRPDGVQVGLGQHGAHLEADVRQRVPARRATGRWRRPRARRSRPPRAGRGSRRARRRRS